MIQTSHAIVVDPKKPMVRVQTNLLGILALILTPKVGYLIPSLSYLNTTSVCRPTTMMKTLKTHPLGFLDSTLVGHLTNRVKT